MTDNISKVKIIKDTILKKMSNLNNFFNKIYINK